MTTTWSDHHHHNHQIIVNIAGNIDMWGLTGSCTYSLSRFVCFEVCCQRLFWSLHTWVRASPRVNGIDAVRKRSDIARINTKMFLKERQHYLKIQNSVWGRVSVCPSVFRNLFLTISVFWLKAPNLLRARHVLGSTCTSGHIDPTDIQIFGFKPGISTSMNCFIRFHFTAASASPPDMSMPKSQGSFPQLKMWQFWIPTSFTDSKATGSSISKEYRRPQDSFEGLQELKYIKFQRFEGVWVF